LTGWILLTTTTNNNSINGYFRQVPLSRELKQLIVFYSIGRLNNAEEIWEILFVGLLDVPLSLKTLKQLCLDIISRMNDYERAQFVTEDVNHSRAGRKKETH
jgi:hypothetical protein